MTPKIILLLLLHIVAASAAVLHQACKNSSATDPNIRYSFCVAALQAAPAARCAALPRLGLLALRLVQDNATDTRCLVKSLIKDKSTPAAAKAPLADCLELYSDAVVTAREAVADYKAGLYLDANVKVSAVMDAAVTCEDGFLDEDVASPVSRPNGFTFQLSAIALSFMNLLQSSA